MRSHFLSFSSSSGAEQDQSSLFSLTKVTLTAGGAKKRVGGRCLDTTLLPQPTVSTISLQHPGSETTAHTSGTGGRAHPSQINYAALPSSAPSSLAGLGTRPGGTQPLQLNCSTLPAQPNSSPSSHSGIGARPAGTQPSHFDYFSPNNDRWISVADFYSLTKSLTNACLLIMVMFRGVHLRGSDTQFQGGTCEIL